MAPLKESEQTCFVFWETPVTASGKVGEVSKCFCWPDEWADSTGVGALLLDLLKSFLATQCIFHYKDMIDST